ncbi:MAG: chemotaxis protein CheX [Oligoflexia bacterium]|nr:chemotaxis protein CheX [Oligoflexia bacterium]
MSNQQFIEFSKPFIQAAKVVFETMIFTKIEPGKPSIKKDATSRGDVSAVLGVTGKYEKDGKQDEVRAMLVLSWPYDTYVKIANAMLMESFTEYNDAICDVGAEISNMILGNAKRDLRGLGYILDMSIPSTIGGPNHTINYPPGTTVVLIPIISAHGEFFMELCTKG